MCDNCEPLSAGRDSAPVCISRRQLLSTALAGCLGSLLAACSARATPTVAPATATAVSQATAVTPATALPTGTAGSIASASTRPAPSNSPPASGPTATATVAPPTFTPAPIGGRHASFGMTMHFMWYDTAQALRELDQLQAAGLTVARFDLAWRQVEPEVKGEYDLATLTKLDGLLRAMDARGIRPIITVIETPEWARDYKGGKFTPPVKLQDYADVMAVLARRYVARPNMVWEIWNEPNLIEFWDTGPNAAQYTDMLRRSYKAIKAVAPEATVIGGAIVFNDIKYLRAMYAGGAKGTFDGLALHPYAPGRAPDDRGDPYGNFGAIQDMRAVMAANNEPDKPIWVTEIGWELDLITEETRARYLARAVELVRSWPYVRSFCVYTLNQNVGPDAQKFGLYNPDSAENLSWNAYIQAARAV